MPKSAILVRAEHQQNSIDPWRNSAAPVSLEDYPVATVEISSLILDGSPRLSGENHEHTRALADSPDVLPPITVHKPTMRVIDGRHRIQAAMLNGENLIDARLIDCDKDTAYVLSVTANITHGLPLSPADRRAAAAHILASHPHWSDRAIAKSVGLSDKTISAIRRQATADSPQLPTRRFGEDKRARPLNTAILRRQAAEMLKEQPEASMREIARSTGLSPGTVRNVRERINNGEDPVPPRYRDADDRSSPAPSPPPRTQPQRVDRRALLCKMRNDPALRLSETGRHLVRWLQQYALDPDSWQGLPAGVPHHWLLPIADLARSSAQAWTTLAEQLEERSREIEHDQPPDNRATPSAPQT